MGKEKQEWTKIFLSIIANGLYLEGKYAAWLLRGFWYTEFLLGSLSSTKAETMIFFHREENKCSLRNIQRASTCHTQICLLFIEHHSWFFQGQNPIFFYQVANATKYIRKIKFNRLLKIFPFKILKSKQLSPHMYAALTHLSAEYFMDLR